MADSSFDIVSEVDHMEVDNAFNQADREIATRFDFKNTDSKIEKSGEKILIEAQSEEKAKAVLEVFKEQKTLTLAQLSSEFELHATQISEWKKQVISAMPGLFTEKKALISEDEREELTAALYQQIGQLKVELDFLKKRLRKNP